MTDSEGTEVKKDIEWGIDQINKERHEYEDARYEREVDDFTTGVLCGLNKGLAIMSQLDEPEVLSQEWLDKHLFSLGDEYLWKEAVPVDDLQNLLVPKEDEATETRYYVRHKVLKMGTKPGYLNYDHNTEVFFLDNKREVGRYQTKFTKTELKLYAVQGNFVWDSQEWKLERVED